MKRPGDLIGKMADPENLLLAYYKAQKGKAGKSAVFEYGKGLQANLHELRQKILSGDVETGNYHYFTIYDPKERIICAAPFGQRVLHHALMNVCHPFFEKVQIFDSYASRVGKGTYAALVRAKRFHKHYKWFLKLDFRKYFDSLDHTVVKNQLRLLFKDERLLNIFASIIDSYESKLPGTLKVTGSCCRRGVPIGNLTSQYFANHYLACADHYVKEILKIPAYIRYMDDQVMWCDDKERLLNAGLRLQQYSGSALRLKLKPFCLNRNFYGLPFLGYLLYPGKTRLAHRSRHRFIKRLKIYTHNFIAGIWTQKEYQNHVLPLIAFTEYADAKAFRQLNW